MDMSEKDFSEVKFISYLIAGVIDLVLAGACIKSNMHTMPKLGLTILCIEHSERMVETSLKQAKVNGERIRVIK